MSSSVFTSPHQNWLDNSGKPLAGGRLYVYNGGTTTPADTWQDAAHSIVNTNPIILDSGGFASVWLDDTKSYKFRMVDAMGVQQWTVDNYQGVSLTANILVPINYLLPATAGNNISNANFTQVWSWQLTGTGGTDAFAIQETFGAPSSNTGPGTALLGVSCVPGSTIAPFRAMANVTGIDVGVGLMVDPSGNIVAVNGSIFIGPVRLPAWPNQGVLGTDALGNIIPGTGGGGGIGANFVDDEVVSGSGLSFSLAIAPNPTASLQLFQFLPGFGSVLLRENIDYAISGTVITTLNPVPAGNLTAWYRTSGGGVTPPPAQPIYSGVGGAGVAAATSVTQLAGTTVTLNTGDTLAQVQTTPETLNQIFSFATLNLNGQYIYLLLTLSTHTVFWDQGNNPFPMNAPITVTVGGATMYLYRSQNQMYGTTWTIQLRN